MTRRLVLAVVAAATLTSCTLTRLPDGTLRSPHHWDPFLVCVRAHESDRAGGYIARNRSSGASGAFQFLDSTWRNVAPAAGYPGYPRAMDAPEWIQDEVAAWTVAHVGRSPWAGTGC